MCLGPRRPGVCGSNSCTKERNRVHTSQYTPGCPWQGCAIMTHVLPNGSTTAGVVVIFKRRCNVLSEVLLNYCTHDIGDDAHGCRGSHKGICRAGEGEKHNKRVAKYGRKTGLEASYARPTTYESRPWMVRAGWRAQLSLRCTAVGYAVATCDLIGFGKSKTP